MVTLLQTNSGVGSIMIHHYFTREKTITRNHNRDSKVEDKSCCFFWLGIEGKKERSEANKDDEGNRRLFCNTL